MVRYSQRYGKEFSNDYVAGELEIIRPLTWASALRCAWGPELSVE